MSHIKTKRELLKLKVYLSELEKQDTSRQVIEAILDDLIPKNRSDKNMIGTVVTSGTIAQPAYMPHYNTINVSAHGFDKITEKSAEALINNTECKNFARLKAYYRLFALLHEVEHGHQFLIARNELPFKYSEVKEGYKNIIESVSKSSSIIPNPARDLMQAIRFFKYQKNEYRYILERNATVEAADDISYLASTEFPLEDARGRVDEDIKKVFEELRDAFMYIGYEDDTKGCMYQTHKGLWLLRKYDKIKIEDISEEDKLRFGLEINPETRSKLLSKYKDSNMKL